MQRQITHLAKNILPESLRIALRKLNWKFKYFVQTTFEPTYEAEVYCPIAERNFKKFVRIKGHLVTPTNGARNRQRLVWLYLQRETTIFAKPARLLHVAPEKAFMAKFKKVSTLDYVPGDKMVEGYTNQEGIMNIDLTQLSFADNSFDYIVCNHVLEHIPEDRKAISEMYRVLKTGGKAIVTIPIKESLSTTFEDPTIVSPQEREKNYGKWDHVRYYGLDVEKRFESVGFKVDMNRYGSKFSKADYYKYGLCGDIIIVALK